MSNVCFNGNFFSSSIPVLHASNRGFAYGDGLFETIRVLRGKIPLADLHFERLFQSMELMQIPPGSLSSQVLTKYIQELCEQNGCTDAARVRLAVYRSNESHAHFIIQTMELDEKYRSWNDKGWSLDVFEDAKKSTDKFSVLKSANFLPYVMGNIYAQKHHFDDVLLLNSKGSIADSTRANIFIVKNDRILTPSLEEGCVRGVMRSLLIRDFLPTHRLSETSIMVEDIHEADEVFMTNAIFGIRWVSQFRERSFGCNFSKELYSKLSATIFS
jgi:branched-chain amino acid aminotransferase